MTGDLMIVLFDVNDVSTFFFLVRISLKDCLMKQLANKIDESNQQKNIFQQRQNQKRFKKKKRKCNWFVFFSDQFCVIFGYRKQIVWYNWLLPRYVLNDVKKRRNKTKIESYQKHTHMHVLLGFFFRYPINTLKVVWQKNSIIQFIWWKKNSNFNL